MTSGERCKYNKKKRELIFSFLDSTDKSKPIFPNILAITFKITPKRLTSFLRERDDLYREKACQERSVGSVWRFK